MGNIEKIGYDVSDIKELAINCYKNAFKAGWYTDMITGQPKIKTEDEHFALTSSEIFEAFEGWRKNLTDDKLPQYPNAVVEFADVQIRLYDWMGYKRWYSNEVESEISYDTDGSFPFHINEMNKQLSKLRDDELIFVNIECVDELPNPEYYRVGQMLYSNSDEGVYMTTHSYDNDSNVWIHCRDVSVKTIIEDYYKLLCYVDAVSEHFYPDYDLNNVVSDKIEFNANREDHKIENRLKEGGKRI